MPLFGSKKTHDPVLDNDAEFQNRDTHARKGSLFSKRQSVGQTPPPATTTTRDERKGSGGLFNRRRSSGSSVDDGHRNRGTGNHTGSDASIVNARQKLADAEHAESEAKRALDHAKRAVLEARNHIGILEREADQDARAARAKQKEAKSLKKGATGLGRI